MRRGIVLSNLKYGDNSNIIKLYTSDKGIDTIIISSAKKNRKVALLQALSEVDFISTNAKGRGIARAKELRSTNRFNYPIHPSIHAIRYFLAEFLVNTLQEEEANSSLYSFLSEQLSLLCELEVKSEFVITFLMKIAPFLGFLIEDDDHLGVKIFNKEEAQIIDALNNGIKIDRKERQFCLNALLRFYDQQFNRISKLKTLNVLKETFN